MKMKSKCTDNGKRVKEAMKAAAAGKTQKAAYGKQVKKEEKGYA
jgi:hypothetical protein